MNFGAVLGTRQLFADCALTNATLTQHVGDVGHLAVIAIRDDATASVRPDARKNCVDRIALGGELVQLVKLFHRRGIAR